MEARTKMILDAGLRLALRMLPLLPAPELYDVVKSLRRNEHNLDKQIQQAVSALSKSSQLIDSLGDTLKERESKLTSLQQEYNRISQLASLTADQGEAVVASLSKLLGSFQNKERFVSFIINLISGLLIFVLGVFASDWVKGIPTWFHTH